MVILDEKFIPPPPYVGFSSPPPQLLTCRHCPENLSNLPPNLLVSIIYMTFPQTSCAGSSTSVRGRETCYWLTFQLRLVNRAFYQACMHVLRSIYLPAYESEIRPPYSSDPFPMSSIVDIVQRETQVLDSFITLKAREDFFMDASELHLGREELFKDIFDLKQPRSRLEDLVRFYGSRQGVVRIDSPSAQPPTLVSNQSGNNSPHTTPRGAINGSWRFTPIPLSALSVSFSPRKVGLVFSLSPGRKRTLVEVMRHPNEELEVAAKALVNSLKIWLSSGNRAT